MLNKNYLKYLTKFPPKNSIKPLKLFKYPKKTRAYNWNAYLISEYSFLLKREKKKTDISILYNDIYKKAKESTISSDLDPKILNSALNQAVVLRKEVGKNTCGMSEIQKLNILIQILVELKEKPVIFKDQVKVSMIEFLEIEILNLDIFHIELEKNFFKLLSLCFNNHYHSRNIYEFISKALKIIDIFPDSKLDRYFIINLYILHYEKHPIKSKMFKLCFDHIMHNFRQLYIKNTIRDNLHLLDTLTNVDSSYNPFATEILNRFSQDMNLMNHDQILACFTYFCKGNYFEKNNELLENFNNLIKNINFGNLSKDTHDLICSWLHKIHLNSKTLYLKELDYLLEQPTRIDNSVFNRLISNYENSVSLPKLDILLNRAIAFNLKSYSISAISSYVFYLSKFKSVDLAQIPLFEKELIKRDKSHEWNSLLIHQIFNGFIDLNLFEADTLTFLLPKIQAILGKENEFNKILTLYWDISRTNLNLDLEFFDNLNEKIVKVFISDATDENQISVFCQCISLSISKYVLKTPEAYRSNKQKRSGYLAKVIDTLQSKSEIFKYDKSFEKAQMKILHFIMVLKIEHSEIISNTNLNNFIDEFKYKAFDFEGTQSNLMIDFIETLKLVNTNYKTEQRIYGFLVDIFIHPNIIIEIDGVKHFDRKNCVSKSTDTLKNFILSNSGYKICRIPYFEFRQIAQKDRKLYVSNKLQEHSIF